jgi:hypothetical protein
MRAQVLQFSTDDRETAGGNRTDTSITFRIRYTGGVDLDHRVLYERDTFTIKNIKEFGRRVGLDLIAERVGSSCVGVISQGYGPTFQPMLPARLRRSNQQLGNRVLLG